MSSGRKPTAPLSVVMPVHNALPHLDEAVASILAQSFADFEFVIFDDASDDGSSERLQEWARRDERIRLHRGERNLGPAASSNRVVELASAPLVARMDADDIAMPDRLGREASLLDERPDVGLVGSLCEVIDSSGRKLRGPDFWRLARRSWSPPFPHGSILFRRDVFDAVGGYRDRCEYWEDLDFVLRVAGQSKILVIPEPLYLYRQSDTSTRIASDQLRVERAMDLRYRSLERVRQNRGYDDLLNTGNRVDGDRVDPRVFISLGSLVLWSNRRPRLLGRLLGRGRLSFDVATISALVWTAWASVSPTTLRSLMHFISRLRNANAKDSPRDDAVEWGTPARLADGKVGQPSKVAMKAALSRD